MAHVAMSAKSITVSLLACLCGLAVACNGGCERAGMGTPPPAAAPPTISVPPATTTAVDRGDGSEAVRPTPAVPGTVVSRDGTLSLEARPIHAIHSHRGPPAQVGRFLVTVRNSGREPRRVTFRAVALLTGQSCDEPASAVRSRPKPELLVRDDDHDLRPPSTTGSVAAGTSVTFSAQFESVNVTYTHCDSFALLAEFSIDDAETLQLRAALRVTREDP